MKLTSDKALNKEGMNLDVDKAITLGYIHDIGKQVREFYLCTAGGIPEDIPFRTEFIKN